MAEALSDTAPRLEHPWALDASNVERALETDRVAGLSDEDAAQRQLEWGPNHLRRHKSRSIGRILLDQFRSFVVWLLIAAAIAAALFGEWLEAAAVAVVVFINTGLGFAMELSARRSMEALRNIGGVQATVVRSGNPRRIPAEELVPGDLALFEAGDVVSADLRIIEAANLEANESILTGESLPVVKETDPVDRDAVVAERSSMLFKGSAISHGNARAIVVATGMNTEIGKISALVASVGESSTPLEVRLDQLARKLVWLCVGLAVLVAIATLLQGRPLIFVVELAVALAVATIPEGLPVVATLALSRGMWRMSRLNAVVKNLGAVETLGSTSVICTDKTGTLTENHLTVARVQSPRPEREVLELGVLCNEASLSQDGGVGDALEVALLEAGQLHGIERLELIASMPRERLIAFDNSTNMMATVHRQPVGEPPGHLFAVKGAPEAVFDAATHAVTAKGIEPLTPQLRAEWMEANEALAAQGLRVIAAARKHDTLEAPPYEGLTLAGLIAFSDPLRENVHDAVRDCLRAGIHVVMITGDQPVTALSIARQAGIVCEGEAVHGRDVDHTDPEKLRAARVFARVDPAQKLDIIDLHQSAGQVVAMTGDGVNDAPALRKADIGVAMGLRGTDVAREAADMVLRDDSFPTIVAAIRQGRIIFDNIRSFVVYLLACNVSELLVIGLATLLFPSSALPITPLQILYLNLITDVFPALALGLGEGDDSVMHRTPRGIDEPVLTRANWFAIAGYGVFMAIVTLAVFATSLFVLELGVDRAVTISFCTIAFAQLFHVFNMSGPRASVLRNHVTTNPYVWGAVLLCTVLILGPFAFGPFAEILSLVRLPAIGWALVAAGALTPLLLGTALRLISRATPTRPSR